MRSSLPVTLDHILASEGGWANDPRDPGGCTMRGITLKTWRAHGHPKASCAGLRHITRADAEAIYTATYWAQVQGDRLPVGVDVTICDHAVNAGPRSAVIILQQTLSVVADGDIGPKTIAAAETVDAGYLVREVTARRRAYYQGLKGYRTFGGGWEARVSNARDAAERLIRMAGRAQAQPTVTGGA